MAIPTLEETLREVATNPYLTAILQLAQQCARFGRTDVDCRDMIVAAGIASEYGIFEDELSSPQAELLEDIRSLTHAQRLAVVPHLRRLGYAVTVYSSRRGVPLSTPFTIDLPGEARRPGIRVFPVKRQLETYHYATSPGILRLRGFLWCTPRLMAWKWRAIVKAHAPDKPGGQRSRAEYALYLRRGVAVPESKRRRIECDLYLQKQWPITMWLG